MSEDICNWIKLNRSLLKWEWYKDIPVKTLFIHFLLNANFAPSKFQGHDISVGSLPTGLPKLSEQTGLSIQQIRTAICKLKSTGEITVTKTSKFSIITITKWNKYQASNSNSNIGATGEQQHYKKERNKESPPSPPHEKSAEKNGDGDGGDFENKFSGDGDFSISAYLCADDRERAKVISGGRDLGPFIQAYDEGVHSGKRSVPRHPAKAFLAWLPLYLKKEPAPPKPDRATSPKPPNHPPRQDWHDRAEKVFGEARFKSWIRPLSFENGIITAPSGFHKNYIIEHFEQDLRQILGLKDFTIKIKGENA
jgi:hypothetical protein